MSISIYARSKKRIHTIILSNKTIDRSLFNYRKKTRVVDPGWEKKTESGLIEFTITLDTKK